MTAVGDRYGKSAWSATLVPIRLPSLARPAAGSAEPTTLSADHPYADFVAQVEKPGRYLGGEFQSVRKPWADAQVPLGPGLSRCLRDRDVAPRHKDSVLAPEQAPRHRLRARLTPWVDMEAELRRRGLPLLSLESARPLADFDVVGMSLQYELTYTNRLTLLDLGGIPLRAAERGDHHPLIIGGGPTATHRANRAVLRLLPPR